jgi:Tol biopolymer transport system component
MSLHQKHGIVSYCKTVLIASTAGFSIIALTGCASPTKPDQDRVMESIGYSGFGGRIAFSRTYNGDLATTDRNYLVVLDATQKTAKLIRVHGHSTVCEASVALSPVTDQLVISAFDDADISYKLYTIDSSGMMVKLTDYGIYPVFTHDGQWAFYQVNSDYSYVYRTKPDGTANTQLFVYGRTRYVNGHISLSPDGTRLTFPVNAGGANTARVCVANIDGTGYREIVKAGNNESLYGTAWSWDGNKIAFVSRRGPNEGNQPPYVYTIMSVDTAGNGLETICTMQQNSYYCDVFFAWSPDGSHVAYNQFAAGDQGAHIFVVDTGGGAPVKITSGNSWDSGPCWVR